MNALISFLLQPIFKKAVKLDIDAISYLNN